MHERGHSKDNSKDGADESAAGGGRVRLRGCGEGPLTWHLHSAQIRESCQRLEVQDWGPVDVGSGCSVCNSPHRITQAATSGQQCL